MMRGILRDERGQATVEAAFLLPTVLLVLGMLLQPACLIYTRMVMDQAAAETARLLVTSSGEMDAVRAYCLRRLAAVPQIGLFHVGGEEGWEIDLEEVDGEVEVVITGHARPLPVFGMLAGVVLEHDADGVVLAVRCTQRLRPAWLGGGPDGWVQVWND